MYCARKRIFFIYIRVSVIASQLRDKVEGFEMAHAMYLDRIFAGKKFRPSAMLYAKVELNNFACTIKKSHISKPINYYKKIIAYSIA